MFEVIPHLHNLDCYIDSVDLMEGDLPTMLFQSCIHFGMLQVVLVFKMVTGNNQRSRHVSYQHTFFVFVAGPTYLMSYVCGSGEQPAIYSGQSDLTLKWRTFPKQEEFTAFEVQIKACEFCVIVSSILRSSFFIAFDSFLTKKTMCMEHS